jgi:hypothetical protein
MLAAAQYNLSMGTTTMVTVQEFLALPEVDGQRIELIGGEVVSMGRGSKGARVGKSESDRAAVSLDSTKSCVQVTRRNNLRTQ